MHRLTFIRAVVHSGAWLPLIVLGVDALNNNLTFNPIQAATQRTGGTAIILLGLSLACSPLSTYFQWKEAVKLRRPLGLYAFLYAALHFTLFVAVDFGFDFNLIVRKFVEKRYLWAGLPAFIILLALAATSCQWCMKRMGKRWKALHRLVYLGVVLVVLHLAFVIKGDLFTLSGDVWKPLTAAVAFGALLLVRVPPLKRAWLARRAADRRAAQTVKSALAKD